MTDHLQSKKCEMGIPVWYRGAISLLLAEKRRFLSSANYQQIKSV